METESHRLYETNCSTSPPTSLVRERAMEATDFYLRSIKGVEKINSKQNDPLRVGVTDRAADSFYRAKLRDGFVDLRNSYHQRTNQRMRWAQQKQQQPSVYGSQSNMAAAPSPKPRNGVDRPVSIHGSTSLSQYARETSHASTDSFSYTTSNPPLFRSSSDLHLENSLINDSHLDYRGSTDLLEAKKPMYPPAGDAEFFAMLQSYKSADNADQRAPAPPGIQNVFKNQDGEKTASAISGSPVKQQQYVTPILAAPVQNGVASSPPSQQTVELRRSPKANRKSRPRSGEVGGLLRKLRSTKSDAESTTSRGSDEVLGVDLEDRVRRKAVAYYDCQSIGINFVEAALRRQNTQLGNTKTGASAASDLDSLAVDGEESLGPVSPLVCNCPTFVNEIGGEEERNIALTRATAQRKVQQLLGSFHGSGEHMLMRKPPVCNGLSILDSSSTDNGPKMDSLERHRGYLLEYRDKGCIYYRHHFRYGEHQNYFGIDENLGPVAISIKREKTSPHNSIAEYDNHAYMYRLIIRTSELKVLRGMVLEDALPAAGKLSNSSRGLPAKDIIEYIAPEIHISCLRQAINDDKTKDQLLQLDEQGRSDSYKVGIMYCKSGQSSEEEMYNNEYSSPAFDEFLDLIARKVRLKGFEKFRGGLDNKTDTTGTHSYYTTCQGYEIMFHVSTHLPYTVNNIQQVQRKRHIGNDIVTIVFQEPGSKPFSVKSVRSHFQHVFIVVQVSNPNTDHTCYTVALTRSKDVPSFGPPLPENSTFNKDSAFADFLVTKIINAENASHHSHKFQAMAVRTRRAYMKELATNYTTNNSLESSKLSKFSLGGSKKKDKKMRKVVPDVLSKGAIVWPTQLEDFGQSTLVDVYLAISAENLVIIEMDTLEPIFTCWSSSVIGWTNSQSTNSNSSIADSGGLRIYYNHGECIVVKPIDQDDTLEIIERLKICSHSCETQEMDLRRNEFGQLGFHVHHEGVVSDVEEQGFAWDAGLRPGSRLVEICKVATATLTHDHMIDLLRTSAAVKVVAIPPVSEGKPRRSREDRNDDYYLIYPTEETRSRRDEESWFSDDEHAMMSARCVTLRSNSSGGSSSSPMSTLSNRNMYSSRHHSDHGYVVMRDSNHNHQRSQDSDPTLSKSYDSRNGHEYSGASFYQQRGYETDTQISNGDRRNTGQYNPSRQAVARRGAKDALNNWQRSQSPPTMSSLTNHTSGYGSRSPPSSRKQYRDSGVVSDSSPTSTMRSQESISYHQGYSNHAYKAPYYQNQTSAFNNPGEGMYASIHKTLSDESLYNPRRSPPPVGHFSNRRSSHDVAYVKPTRSVPPADVVQSGELEWNKLVNTATKAIEGVHRQSHTDQQDEGNDERNQYVTLVIRPRDNSNGDHSNLSHDTYADRCHSPRSGQSTPTTRSMEEKVRDLELKCNRLERDLHLERMRARDLERRLNTAKSSNEEAKQEIARLRSDNDILRSDIEQARIQDFLHTYDGPETNLT